MPAILAKRAAAVLLGLALTTTGCSITGESTPAFGPSNRYAPVIGPGPSGEASVKGFLGGVAADEPYAALTARNVLVGGGNAADAAVAAALTMTVTYPSRAGLGGGGACLAFSPKRGAQGAEAIMFLPGAPASAAGDRPAAVPMMARGLYLLHARHGKVPFETLVTPAEQAARSGVTASRAFVQDLRIVAGPLSGDPVAAAIFLPGGQPLGEGQGLIQSDLAGTLAQLRTVGVGDLYQGLLARQFAAAAQAAGGAVTLDDLRAGLPRAADPLVVQISGSENAYFVPPPADGGLAAAVAFRSLIANRTDIEAARNAGLGAATRWRREGGDANAILNAASQPAPALPALPASAGLAVLDREGNAVVCDFTMNNLFGTGRIAGRTGVLLAASPQSHPPALLSLGMAVNPNLRAFHAMAAGTGQDGAPLAAAVALGQAVLTGQAMSTTVPEPGRATAIVCGRYLPGSEASCNWSTDPRGMGIAVGSN